jgi:hypothetical protein
MKQTFALKHWPGEMPAGFRDDAPVVGLGRFPAHGLQTGGRNRCCNAKTDGDPLTHK